MRPKRRYPVALVLAKVFLLQGNSNVKHGFITYYVLKIGWVDDRWQWHLWRAAPLYLHVDQKKRVYAYRDYFVAPIILPSSIGRVSVNS